MEIRTGLLAGYLSPRKQFTATFVFLVLTFIVQIRAFGQDSLTVDKKKIDKIIKKEIRKMEPKYQDGYKAGRVTWTFPKKVAKDKLIPVEIKLDGETFLYYDYDPITYKFKGGIDLR